MTCLALDIGGANLKAADGRGFATSRPFPLWQRPHDLTAELAELIASAPPSQRFVATMTGELADCFENKMAGVRAITTALVEAAAGRPVRIYATTGEFLTPTIAVERHLAVASSNWHALASFAAAMLPGRRGLLIDVGSTTADLIPFDAGMPVAVGTTDPERLASGELVYTGVERTPVAAIVRKLPWRDSDYPVASELFATSADAYLMLGDIHEDAQNHDTADGRPRTRAAAQARLARMVCADATMFTEDDAMRAAEAIRAAQIELLSAAAHRVLARLNELPGVLIFSGHGEFLAKALQPHLGLGPGPPEVLSLNTALGPQISRCAPAHALAVLADSRFGNDWAP